MIRKAAIDIGTNSARLLIGESNTTAGLRRLYEERIPCRLGDGAFQSGMLQPQALQRTVAALGQFRKTLDEYAVSEVRIYGTATLREVNNAGELIVAVQDTLGLTIEVVSGEREAALIALGVLAELPAVQDGYIIDIGGGSTEIIAFKGRSVIVAESLPLGAARAQQEVLLTVPPTAQSCRDLAQLVSIQMQRLQRHRFAPVDKAIGSSGSIRQLERIAQRRHGPAIGVTLPFLDSLIEELRPLPLSRIREIPAMDPERSDLVLAASVILAEIMRATRLSWVDTTTAGLKEGMLVEML